MLDKQIRYTEQLENFWIGKYEDFNRPKSITEEIINKKLKELDIKKNKLKEQREQLERANSNTKTHIITAFKLISNASLLFKNSKNSQKRQLINFVFSNLFLEAENLYYCLRKPFDKLVNLANQPLWRIEWDSNP